MHLFPNSGTLARGFPLLHAATLLSDDSELMCLHTILRELECHKSWTSGIFAFFGVYRLDYFPFSQVRIPGTLKTWRPHKHHFA